MSFLKSAINQVGRDMGKVVSNQIFNDGHSTPYRRTGTSGIRQNNRISTNFKSNFDKAIDFQTGHRPSTLIAKISGVYTVIKNEANQYVSDGYLDTTESDSLFLMMEVFNNKVDDILDILEIDEEANSKEIKQLTTIIEKTSQLFKNTLNISANGCELRNQELLEEADRIENLTFMKFVGLNAVWMGKYAKTGEKSWGSTIIGNLLSLLLFPFVHIAMGIYGAVSFPTERKKEKET